MTARIGLYAGGYQTATDVWPSANWPKPSMTRGEGRATLPMQWESSPDGIELAGRVPRTHVLASSDSTWIVKLRDAPLDRAIRLIAGGSAQPGELLPKADPGSFGIAESAKDELESRCSSWPRAMRAAGIGTRPIQPLQGKVSHLSLEATAPAAYTHCLTP